MLGFSDNSIFIVLILIIPILFISEYFIPEAHSADFITPSKMI